MLKMYGYGPYTFFRDRPEWSDIQPIKQDESPRGIVRIAYSDEFIDVHDYVRAVIAIDERSERVLALTAEALQMNAANYTIWAYRRNVLLTLKSPLAKEHTFARMLLLDHPKNYQLWYHLQWLMMEAAKADGENDPKTVYSRPDSKLFKTLKKELDLIREILNDDSKNYHAWQYRRWLVDFFGVPVKDELRFTELMFLDDTLNNSAWNHRFYTVIEEGLNDSVFDREMNYAVTQLKAMPHNESACNYLLGLVSPLPNAVSKQDVNVAHARLISVRNAVEDLIDNDKDGAGESPPILSLLVDLYYLSLQNRLLKPSPSTEDEDVLKEIADSAMQICDRLSVELDRIRANYWKYRKSQIKDASGKIIPLN
ncbi:unnamed protein product [Rodentolepis nana]|uniref:Protein farnesyltransferase/geranylgeranyltransferase type-1 subunit alpha n=1 Tax=Rodentolepis nana TaxID=102285 RepID=A0A3P7T402_RODNA|nr:unnamed protein product [Rodentolepis nana]